MIVYNMLLEAIDASSAKPEEKVEIKTYLFTYEYNVKELVLKTLENVEQDTKRQNELISFKIGQTRN